MVVHFRSWWRKHPRFTGGLLLALVLGFAGLGAVSASARQLRLIVNPPVSDAKLTVATADTEAPSTPVAIVVAGGANSPILAEITWDAATDNIGVTGYRVWRSKTLTGTYSAIAKVASRDYQDVSGYYSAGYFYKVSALDAAGNESQLSQAAGPVVPSWKNVPHVAFSPATNNCRVCHSLHSPTYRLLTPTAGAAPDGVNTCYVCHDGTAASKNIKSGASNSFALRSGHSIEATTTDPDLTNMCADCHEPHRDEAASKGLPRRTINGATVTGSNNSWCEACHNDSNGWYKGAYPSVAAPSRNASGYPVAGSYPGKTVYNDSSKNVHSLIPSSTVGPRSGGSCLYCHSSHRGANEFDGLTLTFRPTTSATLSDDQANGTYAASCFYCHGGTVPSEFTTAPANIRQFVVGAGTTEGHRIRTAGGKLPVGAQLPCYDCHNPHGSSRGNASLITDELGKNLSTSGADDRRFCLSCHSTYDGKAWDSVSATYTAVSTTATVEGLRRDGADGSILKLPQVAGHNAADTTMDCSTCHGNDYSSASSVNVHNPGAGQDAKHTFTGMSSSCQSAGCHSNKLPDAHAPFVGSGKRYPEYSTSCALCHANTDAGRIPAGATADCSSCHDSSAGGHEAVHEATLGALTEVDSHQGITPITPIECVTCHSSTNLITLHAADCSVCHSSGGPRSSFTTWNKGCQQGDCHPSIHTDASWGHQDSSYCEDCHDSNDWSVPCLDCHLTGPDTEAPTTSSDARPTYTHPASEPAVIRFWVTDNAGPSVYRTYYRLDGGATQVAVNGSVSVPAPSSGSQEHDLEFWSEDWSRNVEQVHQTAHFTIAVDTTAPHTTSNAKAMYTGPAAIKFTATDDSPDFGVRATYYQVDEGAVTTGTSLIIPSPSSTVTHTVYFWSVDGAGNIEARNHVDLTQAVDSYPPVTTLTITKYQASQYPRAYLKATDVGDAGVASMWATIDQGGPVLQTLGGASNGSLTTLYGSSMLEGWYSLRYWAVDSVGNSSSHDTTTFCLDTHGPTLTPPYPWNANTTGTTTVKMAIADAVSGVDTSTIQYSISYYDSSLGKTVYLTGTSDTVVLPAPPSGTRFYSGSFTCYDRAHNYGNGTIGINVSPGPYLLTYLAGSGGTIGGNSSQTVAPGGNGTAVTAVANTGYHFVNWSDGSTANPRTDTGVLADKTVTANFAANTYTLTYTAGANGSITGTSTQTVSYNSSGTTVTAVPNTGYHFVNWSDGNIANPRIDTSVTANKAVSATFAINTYSLKYSAGPNGSISGTTSQTVNYNGSGTAVTAVPNAGYHFVNWSDGSTANPRTDTGVTANKTVTASFAVDGTYTLAYIAGPNGTISGTATQTVAAGGSGTFVTPLPSTGYHFVNWSDGSIANPRRDTNVQADKTVTANFAINLYTLTYIPGANGSIVGSSTQTISHNGFGTAVTAVGNPGYGFVNWSDGSTANPRTDTSVTASKSVTANFGANSPASTDTTSVDLTEYAWVDAPTGSSGGWGRFSIYANGVLIGTKQASASSTWDCPQTNVPSGARIDIVVDAGFTNASYYYDYNVPLTYSIQLPAGVTRLDASTWTGFPNFEVVDSDWPDYGGPYTYVGVPTATIGNIKFTKPAVGSYMLTYAAGANGTISGASPQTVVTGESGTAVTAVPDSGYHFVNWSDGSTANPRTDTNVLANKSVTANFAIGANIQTFAAIGSDVLFTVPVGVSSIAVDLYGAQGMGPVGITGGLGGLVHAQIAVTPGQVLTIRTGTSSSGWPNGGAGSSYGGCGGGSSSILLGTSVLAEAGGGGGSQGYDPGGPGGANVATDPGGNAQGGYAGEWGAGGGGGWNGGASPGDDTSGEGGTSRIAAGFGTMTPGVREGDGLVTISW